MALSLQDFNKPADMKQMRMEAFQPRTTPSPAANPATINTLASYGAALTPDGDINSAYKSIANQLQYSSITISLELSSPFTTTITIGPIPSSLY